MAGTLTISQTLQAASLASTGTVILSNGTISGATILAGSIRCTNTSNTLNGVTLAASATLDLATVNAAQCNVNNATTINGTVLIGSADTSTYGRVYYTSTTTWDGTGTFVLDIAGRACHTGFMYAQRQ